MRAGLKAALALAAGLALPLHALAQAPARPDPADLQNVLDAALYPVQLMAFCFRDVAPNAAFQSAGVEWVRRNGALLARVEALAKSVGLPQSARVDADQKSLEAIRKVVGSQSDQAAYCGLIAGLVDAGSFDLTIRDDLQGALKRIFPGP